MNGILEGKVALITGAGSGIAAAAARLFHKEGARIVLADVSGKEADLAAELGDPLARTGQHQGAFIVVNLSRQSGNGQSQSSNGPRQRCRLFSSSLATETKPGSCYTFMSAVHAGKGRIWDKAAIPSPASKGQVSDNPVINGSGVVRRTRLIDC